jgi:hypothetical protein
MDTQVAGIASAVDGGGDMGQGLAQTAETLWADVSHFVEVVRQS